MEDNKTIEKFQKAQESLVVQQSDFSLKTIAEMVDAGSIDVAPNYQRRERWNIIKQSALIESFILNVPVPPVYLSEDDYGTYSVIDGKQRIITITNYINNKYKLKGITRFPELEGCYFSDLPIKIKNALSIRPYLRVVTLLRQSDPTLKYEVFLRLNTGGEKLKPQEIRNVAYSGPLNDLLYRLSENSFLKHKLKIVDEKSNSYRNMEDLEHILRFFTVSEYWRNIGSILSQEMDKFMEINRHANNGKLDKLKRNFERSIEICELLWGNSAFNKPTATSWREQLISPLYDAQMVAVSELSDIEISFLSNKKREVIEGTKALFNDDKEFNDAVSQATNNAKNVFIRISRMINMLNSIK